MSAILLHALAVHAAADLAGRPPVPNPPAQAPPGLAGPVNTILGWGKWGVLVSGVDRPARSAPGR